MYKFLSSFGIKECISESVAFIDMMQTAHSKEFVYLNPRGNINLVHFRGHDNFNPIQGGLFWGCSWMGGGAGGKKAPSLKFVTHILQL